MGGVVPPGRPKGAGKRWTDYNLAELWAEMKFAMRRDDHSEVRRAARNLEVRCFYQIADDKIWESRNPTESELKNNQPFARAKLMLRPGDRRIDNPVEVFRAAYYQAERRRQVNAEFRSRCDWFLQSRIEGVFRFTATFRRRPKKA